MPGVDIVLPDLTYLQQNRERIRGVVITHGHEDHIGAIPYLLKQINVPIFATRLTLGLVAGKLKEHSLQHSASLNEVKPGETVQLGCFKMWNASTSTTPSPTPCALAITTPAGVVVQTGDFKIDCTPIDGRHDRSCPVLPSWARKGVLALLSDSTNAERPGYTPSERIVGELLLPICLRMRRTSASSSRPSPPTSTAYSRLSTRRCKHGTARSPCLGAQHDQCGRRRARSWAISRCPTACSSISTRSANTPTDQLVIVTTGSQGEPMSALRRMAFGDHRQVSVGPDDLIIISATPIPGNEKTVSAVVNELLKLGAEVVYEKMYDVHVSGHACQEELKMMLGAGAALSISFRCTASRSICASTLSWRRPGGDDENNILIAEHRQRASS